MKIASFVAIAFAAALSFLGGDAYASSMQTIANSINQVSVGYATTTSSVRAETLSANVSYVGNALYHNAFLSAGVGMETANAPAVTVDQKGLAARIGRAFDIRGMGIAAVPYAQATYDATSMYGKSHGYAGYGAGVNVYVSPLRHTVVMLGVNGGEMRGDGIYSPEGGFRNVALNLDYAVTSRVHIGATAVNGHYDYAMGGATVHQYGVYAGLGF